MTSKPMRRWVCALFAGLALLPPATARADEDAFRSRLGPLFRPAQEPAQGPRLPPSPHGKDVVRRWSQIAIDTSGLDHTPVQPGESRVFGEQFGPGRASRAMAIVHVAMFDAVAAIVGGYETYTGIGRAPRGTSLEAAVAQAAHDTLVALFPSQTERIDGLLAEDLGGVRGRPRSEVRGIALGKEAAAAILARVAGDAAASLPEPHMGTEFVTSDQPGFWRQDPVSLAPLAIGAHWGEVRPFVMHSGDEFRAPPPPALPSPEYAEAYAEVKALGGDGVTTPTLRTEEQTEIGIFWAYDGTPSLCAPTRLYNQILVAIADLRHTGLVETARLLALANVAMSDAAIAVWESKFHYQLWRPVTGIRESDPGTGPTGLGDGNDLTVGDPTFMPLGAPASNLGGPNFTPPFPSYPSGHAGFAGAVFQTLRRFYGTDQIAFDFVSDEWNGVTVGSDGQVRPLRPRHFASLSQAEEENGQSRIYLGIHWAFDKTEGIAQGRRVADAVLRTVFRPLPHPRRF